MLDHYTEAHMITSAAIAGHFTFEGSAGLGVGEFEFAGGSERRLRRAYAIIVHECFSSGIFAPISRRISARDILYRIIVLGLFNVTHPSQPAKTPFKTIHYPTRPTFLPDPDDE